MYSLLCVAYTEGETFNKYFVFSDIVKEYGSWNVGLFSPECNFFDKKSRPPFGQNNKQ